MPFDAPFSLGPFWVDPTGRLSPDPGAVPAFRVVWRERTLHAAMRDDGSGLGRLTMRITVARVPSTAPKAMAFAREHAFATLRHLPAAMPDGWDICLLADHRIVVQTGTRLDLPASAAALVTALTVFLLAVDPYLTLLEETGFGTAACAAGVAGSANTWPG